MLKELVADPAYIYTQGTLDFGIIDVTSCVKTDLSVELCLSIPDFGACLRERDCVFKVEVENPEPWTLFFTDVDSESAEVVSIHFAGNLFEKEMSPAEVIGEKPTK